jgi:hypothetical protein
MPNWQLIALTAGGVGLLLGIYLARRSHQADPLQSAIAHIFHYLAAAAVGAIPFGIIAGLALGDLRSGVLIALVALGAAIALTVLYALPESAARRGKPKLARPFSRLAWDRWLTLAGPIGDFNARLLMGILYFSLLVPFGVPSRLFSDRLRLKKPPPDAPLWVPREGVADMTLDEARRQF